MILLSGPCQHESVEHSDFMYKEIASTIDMVGLKRKDEHYFKASFDKANRSSIQGKRGVGLEQTLADFEQLKRQNPFMKIITDVHECWQVEVIAEVVDAIQIPAFLCRQTDLLVEAGKTGLPVNIKKGQFLSYEEVPGVLSKMDPDGEVWITERGTTFGYNNLVVDFRGLEYMKQFKDDNPNFKVIFDATHSVQQPGAGNGKSLGKREFVAPLSRAAAAVGVDGFFHEVHDAPDRAPSDGPNMLTPGQYHNILEQILNVGH